MSESQPMSKRESESRKRANVLSDMARKLIEGGDVGSGASLLVASEIAILTGTIQSACRMFIETSDEAEGGE